MSEGELLLIIGPQAVGKMTVGRAICAASDFRLFHNHHTIEPLLEIFGYGTPPFETLNAEFRLRVIEEAAASGTRLVFTLVWDVDSEADAAEVRRLVAPYADRGLRISVLELIADLPTRLVRNTGADRLEAKRSKRDLAWSDAHLREMERAHRTNTDPDAPSPADDVLRELPHLRLDNSELSPAEVARRVLEWLDRG
ncbi:hypothetical protein [Nocardioides sp. cx-173]|uniref:hypothetical protein n=1 Tax=Nocardioides sp. cx-173 TaxID=2898796 RepID=UPI001E5C49C4|nr:hypothetical protein [Nocardioides sp. cx-173]MCD4526447.1 hypothetical protein [Nocardioides sp. cx-173]UGB41136.1 hypothetical protein LQ940_17410 [Nocardioides sp. cx-173]